MRTGISVVGDRTYEFGEDGRLIREISAAELLATAKDAAIDEINDAVGALDKNDYSVNNWNTILDEQAKAIAAINSATTIEEVAPAKEAGLGKIARVKTTQ